MTKTSEVAAAEDWVHHPPPGDHWLESFWFGFYDAEKRVGMVSLIGFNAVGERSRLWLLMVEGDAVTVDATDLRLPLAIPDGKAVEVGGYRVEVIDDMARYKLSFESEATAFELEWKATSAVKSTPGTRPFPGQREQGPHGHSEQAGVIGGTLRIGENEYEVDDSPAWRDHLWGHAISDGWSEMGWWTWITGTTVDGKESFNVSAHRFPDGREGFYGFMFVDGEISPLHVDRCEVAKSPSGRHPVSCEVSWADTARGRRYELTGEIIAPLYVEEPVPGGTCIINDPPCAFRLNGQDAYGTLEMGETFS